MTVHRSTIEGGVNPSLQAAMEDSTCAAPERHGRALRRAWGGRLRSFRPKPGDETRLKAVRNALVRGELVLNGFNRWRLLPPNRPAIGWTFTEAGRTEEVAETEIRVARREAGTVRVLDMDETTTEEIGMRIEEEYERVDLLVARRDWSRYSSACPAFGCVIEAARRRGLTIHVIAAFGTVPHPEDDLYREARQRWRFEREPLHRPTPQSSNIERRFGEVLAATGLDPIPQQPVAHYFLDFALIGQMNRLPVRLDVEVDGRRWHEELPGHLRMEDERRDQVLKWLGWRPIRFWTDEIERDETGCIDRIHRESMSATPLASWKTDEKERS